MAYSESGGYSAGPFAGVILVMIGLVVIVALIQFIPMLGGSIEEATPALGATSDWNATHNTAVPSGATMYTQNAALVSLLATVILIVLILAYLVRI